MSDLFYVRIRGKVQGPYDLEKLQVLFQRGQLSRVHEVSKDSANWEKASAYEDIFRSSNSQAKQVDAGAIESGRSEARGAAVMVSDAMTESHSVPMRPPPSKQWYYAAGDQQQGPVDAGMLVEYINRGQLPNDVKIWKQGLDSWLPANQVPELGVPSTSVPVAREFDASSKSRTTLSREVIQPIVASRGWVLFVAVLLYALGAILALAGLTLMIQGGKHDSTEFVVSGLIQLINAILYAVAGFLLTAYATSISKLMLDHTHANLQNAMAALKKFWIFLGVCFITLITMVVVAGLFGWFTAVANFPL